MKKDDLLNLPIDVYSRHDIVAGAVHRLLKTKAPISILDVGGYKGVTHHFFPKDKVTVLDVYDVKGKNYVRGDATKNHYEDGSFDIVTSFDVFEHIPRNSRQDFITESFRVAKSLSIMTLPVNVTTAKRTSKAEINLNGFYKKLTKKDHPWLVEHIEYEIPTLDEITELIDKLDMTYRVICSNDLLLWQIIETANFLGTVDGDGLKMAKSINAIYNKNVELLESNVKDPYRAIVLIFKDKTLAKKYDNIVQESKASRHKSDNDIELIGIFINGVADMLNKYRKLQQELNDLQSANDSLAVERDRYQLELRNIKKSRSWRITKPLRLIVSRGGK